MTQDEKITLAIVVIIGSIAAASAFPAATAFVAAVGATLAVAAGFFQFFIKPLIRQAGQAACSLAKAGAEGRERARLERAKRRSLSTQEQTARDQLRRENARLFLELQYLQSADAGEGLPRSELDQLLNRYMNDEQQASAVEARQPLIQQSIRQLSQDGTRIQQPVYGDQLRSLYEDHQRRLAAIQSLPRKDDANAESSLEDYRDELREIEERRFLALMRDLTAGSDTPSPGDLPSFQRPHL